MHLWAPLQDVDMPACLDCACCADFCLFTACHRASACTTHARSSTLAETPRSLAGMCSTQETSSQLQLGGDTLSEQQHRLDEAIKRVRSGLL